MSRKDKFLLFEKSISCWTKECRKCLFAGETLVKELDLNMWSLELQVVDSGAEEESQEP